MATATTSFATTVDDVEIIVHAGEELPDDHPAVEANPELFAAKPKTRAKPKTTRAKK